MKKGKTTPTTGADNKTVATGDSVGIIFKLSDNAAAAILRWLASLRG